MNLGVKMCRKGLGDRRKARLYVLRRGRRTLPRIGGNCAAISRASERECVRDEEESAVLCVKVREWRDEEKTSK